MRQDNSVEHRAVLKRLDTLDSKVDSLESGQDRKAGRSAVVSGIALALASLFGALFGSHT